MWASLWAFSSRRYWPMWKQCAAAHRPRKPHLWAASRLDGKLTREENWCRRHWKNKEDMQIQPATPEASQLVENKKWWPRHPERPDARAQAFENIPLSQNCHSQFEENHQVPSQLHNVQIISEAIFRNDRESGPNSKNKLLITRNGHWAVSSQWSRSDGWIDCFSGIWGGTRISFSSPMAKKLWCGERTNITPKVQ